ncbi:MAG: hypothetical protein H7Z17_08155 [Fuerstia sp.]|nr:hypothetical protein [Fuerstiella sp.]
MNDFLRYRRERLPMPLVLSVAALLTVAATAVSERVRAADVVWNVALAGLLMIQFRLWDDLNDIDKDRIDHPDRVLCRLVSHSHFRFVLAILFIINSVALSLSKSPQSATVFVVLNVVFLLWYSVLRGYFNAFLHVHLVLTKYPVFAFLIADEPTSKNKTSVVLMMVVVYGGACIYEYLHNRHARK